MSSSAIPPVCAKVPLAGCVRGSWQPIPSVASQHPASGSQWDPLLCSWSRGNLHFEDAVPVGRHSKIVFVPVWGIVRVELQSSSCCVRSHSRAPLGGHLDGGQGFV